MSVGDAWGRWHWGIRWCFLWGHETCEGVPTGVWVTHVVGGGWAQGPSVGSLWGHKTTCAEICVADACGRRWH